MPVKTPIYFCFILLFLILLTPTVLHAQDKSSLDKEKEENAGQETSEEGRESLKRHLRARLLVKKLKDPEKYHETLDELDELEFEAVGELLASREKAATRALNDLCEIWINELSANSFAARDRAFRLLYAAGEVSSKLLDNVSDSPDVHVSEKAKLLIHMIDFRISPELYERLGHVMAHYEESEWHEKLEIVDQLERLGGALAVEPLKKIIELETNIRVQAHAANSLIHVGTLQDLVFLQQIGLVDKIEEPSLTVEIFLSQGMKYMEAERYSEAIDEFKRALKSAPDDIRAHNGLGMAYLLEKKYSLSVNHYREVLKQEPENVLAHYNLACAYSLMNDVENAIRHLALAIEHGYTDLEHMKKDEDLNNIRSDIRFKELKEKLQEQKDVREGEED